MKAVFTLDTRSLAALRIGLGLLLLANLCDLAPYISDFFSDAGLLPRAARMQLNIEEQFTAPPYWCSLYMLSGASWFAGLLFAISAALAICVTVGYRARCSLFASWLLLVSLQGRNPLVLFGGDDVLRCMLFWSMFLPLGAKWSIDQWRRPSQQPTQVCSLASAALVVQLCCIYLFTALLKSYPEWRSEHTAVYYALSHDHCTTRLGRVLLQFPALLKGLTVTTLIWEFIGPLLLLYTGRFRWLVRLAVVGLFWLLHLGLAATLEIGLFPPICMTCWLAILPGEFWELSCWRRMRLPLPQAVTAWLGSFCSARNVPRPELGDPRPGLAGQVLIGLLLAYVVLLNVARLEPNINVHLNPGPLRTLGDAAQLNQYWCMFAPRPFRFGGWFDIRGVLADGTQVNLLRPDRPPQQTRPELISAEYPTNRWRKALANLIERNCPTYRRSLDEYLRLRWNESHAPNQQIVACDAFYQKVETPPPGGAAGPAEPVLLWHSSATPLAQAGGNREN